MRPWRRVVSVLATACLLSMGMTGLALGGTAAAAADAPQGSSPGRADRPPIGGPRPQAPSGSVNREPAGTVVARSADSNTVATGKGNFRTTVYPAPVNYRNSAGDFVPIEDTLVPAPSGSGEAVQDEANSFTVQLPGKIGAAPVRVMHGGQTVSFSLTGSNLANVAGSVQGAGDTFADALPQTTVRYISGNTGLQEDLILNSAAAPHTFTYSLQLVGLTAKAANGAIEFLDPSGQVGFFMPAPSVMDASGRPSGLGPEATLTLAGTAGNYTLTLAVNAAWLAAPGRQFPVTVDPGINFNGATADCYIINGTDASYNYCGGQSLALGYYGPSSQTLRTLLYYDVAASIPRQAQVQYAELTMDLAGETTSNYPSVTVHALTQSWTTGATWNTYDGTNDWSTAGGTFTSTDYAEAQNVGANGDVLYFWWPTALVQGWLDGSIANDGMILKEAAPENVDNDLIFDSSEDGNVPAYDWPTLSVEWSYQVGIQGFYKLQQIPLDSTTSLYVNAANGNLGVRQTDLHIAGTGLPLDVTRYFNNLPTDTWDLGNNWLMNTGLDVRLFVNNSSSVTFQGPSGYQIPFNLQSDGSWAAPPGINATLVQNSNGTYTLTLLASGLIYNFASGGLLTSEQTRNGNTISFAYNSNTTVTLASITDTQGRVTTFSYNPQGFISTMTGPTGLTYQYAYNSNNDLTTYTNPAGKTTTYGYDTSGDLTSITDPMGHQTALTYNANAQVTSITLPTSAEWKFAYQPDSADAGGSTVVTDPNGNSTTYYYDLHGRVTKVVDPQDNTTSLAYTADGNVNQYTDASNDSTSYTFANVPNLPDGAALTGFTLPTGAGGSFTYGDSNCPFDPTAYTDPQGNTLDYAYDADCNLTSVTDGLSANNKYTFTYNANGTLASMTDAMGNVTTYGYDSNGNLTSITPPSPLDQTSMAYDTLSRITSVTDGRGNKTTYSYNSLDELIGITYADGTSVTSGYNDDGDVTTMTDPTGTTTYTYDHMNRETGKTLPSGATLTYTYDPAGNMASFADAGGTVDYAYNDLNQMTSLTDPQANKTTYTYNAEYQPTSIAYPNGVTMTLTYNSSGQLASIVAKNSGGTELTGYTYSYTNPSTNNATALRYSVQDAAGNSTAYTYDVLNRLTEAKTTNGGTTVSNYQYAYDGNGNRTSQTANGTQTTYTYTAANELTAAGSTTYTYDAAGNETGDSAGLTLAYNAANMTRSVTPPNANAIAMAYTGATQVERVTAGSTTYQYGLSGLANQTTSGASTYFTRTPADQLVSERLPSGTYYYLFDGVGSVVGLTDSTGGLVNAYVYDPYGNLVSQTGTVSNPWMYAGAYFDSATGLYKMGARFYDPTIGRWTQRDPLPGVACTPQTLNPYAYGNDNPILYSDPSGLCSWTAVTLESVLFVTDVVWTIILLPWGLVAWGPVVVVEAVFLFTEVYECL